MKAGLGLATLALLLAVALILPATGPRSNTRVARPHSTLERGAERPVLTRTELPGEEAREETHQTPVPTPANENERVDRAVATLVLELRSATLDLRAWETHAAALAASIPPGTRKHLTAVLNSPPEEDQRLAAGALLTQAAHNLDADPATISGLQRVAARHAEQPVRARIAAGLLGRARSDLALIGLLELLDQGGEAASVATRGLERLEDPDLPSSLVDRLTAEHPGRYASLRCLASIGRSWGADLPVWVRAEIASRLADAPQDERTADHAALAAAQAAWADDTRADVAQMNASPTEAAERILREQASDPAACTEALGHLHALLHDASDPGGRRRALDRLARFDERALPAIVAAAREDPESSVRKSALVALARCAPPELLEQEASASAALDPDEDVRRLADSLLE